MIFINQHRFSDVHVCLPKFDIFSMASNMISDTNKFLELLSSSELELYVEIDMSYFHR